MQCYIFQYFNVLCLIDDAKLSIIFESPKFFRKIFKKFSVGYIWNSNLHGFYSTCFLSPVRLLNSANTLNY